ncbi:unnamed protein product [Pleuronectes platessa]|uniref:Secreted protein n=1 Tax=Pleuronectes platessa TaxID=8262 RepID=A0A9N7YQZ5_PLEPL|nr:unnamed protein product [Pleuronectes platessa]
MKISTFGCVLLILGSFQVQGLGAGCTLTAGSPPPVSSDYSVPPRSNNPLDMCPLASVPASVPLPSGDRSLHRKPGKHQRTHFFSSRPHVSSTTCPPPRVLHHVSSTMCPPPRVLHHVSSTTCPHLGPDYLPASSTCSPSFSFPAV